MGELISPDMKRRGRIYGWVLVASLAGIQGAHGGEYYDVGVIVNMESSDSRAICDYFKASRGIPDKNIIEVTVPVVETIDAATFTAMQTQIESTLVFRDISESINYLVTTKGVPLRVDRGGIGSTYSNSASVESELTCIIGPNKNQIGGCGGVVSPYYMRTERFSRAQFGIYLVTRLDGYSVEDVIQLIDRSGPGMVQDSRARFVLDQDPDWPSAYNFLNTNIDKAGAILKAAGSSVVLNADSTYLTREANVAGYVSWGSNDHHAADVTQNAIPLNTWSPGAIAETYVSTSGRSFANPPSYGQSLVADLIQEGASGAKGYVYEPYATAMADVSVLFGRYTAGYNLSESFYSASRYLSWMDVIIGDPKTSTVELQGVLPIQLLSFTAGLSPDPASVRLSWTTASETNNFGFMVQRRASGGGEFADLPGSLQQGGGTTVSPRTYAWTDSKLVAGTYDYRLRQIDLDGSSHPTETRSVTVATVPTGVAAPFQPVSAGLDQNYPNPFNPSTTIRYRIAVAGQVSLVVYDAVGREVATLVDRFHEPGSYAVVWDARGIAAGMYFCKLIAGQRAWTQRMIALK
jgi:uncharacterized protein (TIGR03790 family)